MPSTRTFRNGLHAFCSPVSRLLLIAAIGVVGRTACAQETAPPPAVDASPGWPTNADDEEERLGRFLERERQAEIRQHWTQAIGAFGVGVPQVVLGEYMNGRTDSAARAIGPGMVVGGAADSLLGIVPLLQPTPMSILQKTYDAERREGKPAGQVVYDIEEQWRAMVIRQRRGRRLGGILELVIGVPAFTTGLVFALAKPGLAGMSPSTQYGWAGALTGFDFAIYQGVAALVAPAPVDTAFDTYERMKHVGASGFAPKVGVVAVPGGAALTVGAAF